MKKSMQLLSSVFVSIIMFSIGFLLLYTLNAFLTINQNEKISSGYITKNAISFEVTEDISVSSLEIARILKPSCYLFVRPTKHLDDITLFSFSNNMQFELLSGRQFSFDDLVSNDELTICGSKRKVALTTSAKSKAMQIGTLGIDHPSPLDYMAIILPSVLEREKLRQGVWIIDGYMDVQQSFDAITHLVGDEFIHWIPTEKVSTYRMENNSLVFESILWGVVACSFIAFSALALYWIQCRSQIFTLAFLFGGKLSRVIYLVTRTIVPLILCSLSAGMLCGFLVVGQGRYIQIVSLGILLGFSFLIVTCIYLTILVLFMCHQKKGGRESWCSLKH